MIVSMMLAHGQMLDRTLYYPDNTKCQHTQDPSFVLLSQLKALFLQLLDIFNINQDEVVGGGIWNVTSHVFCNFNVGRVT